MTPESEFTRLSPRCPHPERYHSPDSEATEDEVTSLVAAMVRALRPDFVLETGTYQGHTTEAMADLLDGDAELVTIELDRERWLDAQARFIDNPNVTCVHGRSLDYFGPLPPIDFAWFDSGINIRADEFMHFLQWMHPRTVVGFHDTAPHHPVRRQLDQLTHRGYMSPALHIDTPRGVSFARPIL